MADISKKITGPINLVRLEGKINGINKVLYTFFDYHMDVKMQTQCDDIYSIDMSKYLAYEFKKINDDVSNNSNYDFFFEHDFKSYKQDSDKFYIKEKYINDTTTFFMKNFNIVDTHNKDNKDFIPMKQNKSMFTKFRFHYTDPRYFNMLPILESCFQYNNMVYENLSQIIQNINLFASNFDVYSHYILHKLNNTPLKTDSDFFKSEDMKYFMYTIDKTFDKYNDKNNKDIINKIANTILIRYIIMLPELIKKLLEIVKIAQTLCQISNNQLVVQSDKSYYYGIDYKMTRKIINEISDSLSELYEKYLHFIVFIMDLFFIRRFVDKDYITNCIGYTGGYHSMNYIYILIKYWDFKITHIVVNNIENIEKLNTIIKTFPLENYSPNSFNEYFFPKIFRQCVDIEHFPPNFT